MNSIEPKLPVVDMSFVMGYLALQELRDYFARWDTRLSRSEKPTLLGADIEDAIFRAAYIEGLIAYDDGQ